MKKLLSSTSQSPVRLLSAFIAAMIIHFAAAPPPLLAGSGRVNSDGTIDVTINFRFPPSATDVTTVRNHVTAASQALWDASEGQLRFGNVTLTSGPVNEDLADVWMFPQPGRATVSFWTDGSGLTRRGDHINMFLPDSNPTVFVHEFGHLALGLADEYSEQSRFGACWGYGRCIELGNLTEQNHCLMQMEGAVSQTEFCTAGNHDPLRGDGISCATRPVPIGCTGNTCCMANCEFFNATTGQYETTQQTHINGGRSCWQHLVRNFSFLRAPAGLPAAAAPANFTNPVFIDNSRATDLVMLVLDRSGSMAWNTEKDNGEVCGDGIDNDGDGSVDEANDCTQPRLQFLKAAGRAWLQLALNKGVRAGVVSFNQAATLDQPFQDVNNANIATLTKAVDTLQAGGNTAIGRALTQTISTFDAQTGRNNKTALLISDGINTEGPDPRTEVQNLRDRGIRVFSVSTGGASDDTALTEISGGTGGSQADSRSATTLVNAYAQQFARYRNIGMLIPKQPYSSPGRNGFQFLVEPGTTRLSLVASGNMSDMSGFGVKTQMGGPGGFFDSEVPDPSMRVENDRYFLLVEIDNPAPGLWAGELLPRPGITQAQSGHLTVIADHPETDLFTSLSASVVDPDTPIELQVTPIHLTTLRHVDTLTAVLTRPDGTQSPIALTSRFDTDGTTDYGGVIANLAEPGMYEVHTYMQTGPSTFNDPGEVIWSTAPDNSLPIPQLERHSVDYFFVLPPKKQCRLRNSEFFFDAADGLPRNTTIFGDAIVDGGWLKLTTAQPDQFGILYIDDFGGKQPVHGFRASFQAALFGSTCCGNGALPADGFSFNLVPAVTVTSNPGYGQPAEEGLDSGLAVNFDTWDNGAREAPAVEVKWLGQLIARQAFQPSQSPGAIADANSARREVLIDLEPNGRISVSYGGVSLIYRAQTPYASGVIGVPKWVVGARTGGANDNHWIDNLSIVADLPSGSPIPGLFNTAVDNQRRPLPDDAPDSHYRLSSATGLATPLAATSFGGFPIGPWLGDNIYSAWIAPGTNTQEAGSVNYAYEIQFDLTGFDPATALIEGQWAADNRGIDILINYATTWQQHSAPPGSPIPFTTWEPFRIDRGFKPDTNVLTFIVRNDGTTPNPTGLRVEMCGSVLPLTSLPPRLHIGWRDSALLVSWHGGGYILQTATNPAGVWSDLSSGSTMDGLTYEVTMPASETYRFFRLRQQ